MYTRLAEYGHKEIDIKNIYITGGTRISGELFPLYNQKTLTPNNRSSWIIKLLNFYQM